MADFADEASELTERHIEEALTKIVRYKGNSMEFCVECGDDIPLERRAAIKGCTRCAFCQDLKEKGRI